ncbi:MAG: DNA polymerase III subunit delta [Kangiellaceae bacterium]|nr:DNA polymerase III subunit delta [Kangiellaceae bacterium]MCW8999170.1 DNA polymerase III subunit delta [Kangiellaceae bacterium]MCW9016146.1 DNA polymerase III subunit delta [Kangiellaceae bacterium]
MSQVSPVNIVISEEPLLLQEACDELLTLARQAGVHQKEIFEVADKFNWNDVLADSGSLSLFSEVKLMDIRFAKVPNKEAQNALVDLAANASHENILLIRLPKLDKRQKSTKWFKSLSQGANVQEIWPPRPHEFVGWLKQRALQYQVNISQSALQLVAEQTEGNLLAADQMLKKLQLMHPEQQIELEQLEAVISDSAKYSVFLCIDEALAGKGARAVKMLHKFRQEAVAPISILVNLTREIDLCNQVSLAVVKGEAPMQALSKSFLWDSKKRLIVSAAQRLPAAVWQRLLARCAYLDRMVKGQEKGDVWNELELCLWMVSGQKIWGTASAG